MSICRVGARGLNLLYIRRLWIQGFFCELLVIREWSPCPSLVDSGSYVQFLCNKDTEVLLKARSVLQHLEGNYSTKMALVPIRTASGNSMNNGGLANKLTTT